MPLVVMLALAHTVVLGDLVPAGVQEGLGFTHTPPLEEEDMEAVLEEVGVGLADTVPRTAK